jgi:hypothetical protein
MLTLVDNLLGLAVYRDGAPGLYVTSARSGHTAEVLVAFPGFVMPGQRLSAAFAAQLPADEALVVIGYPGREVQPNAIFTAVMTTLHQLDPPRVRLFGASMGGMVATDFLTRYARAGAPYGPVVLVLDTTPSSRTDVKMPGWLFAATAWYRGGPVASAVWAMQSRPQNLPEEADTDQRNTNAADHDAAWIGMPAVTGQAGYIRQFHPPANEPGTSVARVAFLQGRDPADDPLVDVAKAVATWRLTFPGLTVVTIESRDGHWHVPLIQRPHEALTAILAV